MSQMSPLSTFVTARSSQGPWFLCFVPTIPDPGAQSPGPSLTIPVPLAVAAAPAQDPSPEEPLVPAHFPAWSRTGQGADVTTGQVRSVTVYSFSPGWTLEMRHQLSAPQSSSSSPRSHFQVSYSAVIISDPSGLSAPAHQLL